MLLSNEGQFYRMRQNRPRLLQCKTAFTYQTNHRFHGNFEKNLPKGRGCFTFDAKYMQHGFYVNMRDPAFDYVGAEELKIKDAPEVEELGAPIGIGKARSS